MPKFDDASLQQAQTLFAEGRVEQAWVVARELLENYPDWGEALYLNACCAVTSNQVALARVFFEAAVRAAPNLAEYWYQLSLCCTRLGSDAALPQLTQESLLLRATQALERARLLAPFESRYQ